LNCNKHVITILYNIIYFRTFYVLSCIIWLYNCNCDICDNLVTGVTIIYNITLHFLSKSKIKKNETKSIILNSDILISFSILCFFSFLPSFLHFFFLSFIVISSCLLLILLLITPTTIFIVLISLSYSLSLTLTISLFFLLPYL